MSPSVIDNLQEPLERSQKLKSPDVLQGTPNAVGVSKYSNPSLQVTADHKIKMVEAPIGKPGPGEVLIHVKATGICGYVLNVFNLPELTEMKVRYSFLETRSHWIPHC